MKNNEHWYWKHQHVLKEKQSIYNSMEENLKSYRIILFRLIWFFPDDFIKKCKDNANEAIDIPIEVK